jgi:hypothetical protein
MNKKIFHSTLLSLFTGFSAIFFGYLLIKFDFEVRTGFSLTNLLIIFLTVTYIPLLYLYLKAKKRGAKGT